MVTDGEGRIQDGGMDRVNTSCSCLYWGHTQTRTHQKVWGLGLVGGSPGSEGDSGQANKRSQLASPKPGDGGRQL